MISIFTGCSMFLTDSIDPYSDTTKDGLEIIYIHPKPPSHDYYTPITFIYNGREYEAEGKIRGATSAYNPKKSYTLKFDDDDLFHNESGEYVEKIVLISTFDDNSYIRTRLAFKIWSIIDENFGITTSNKVVYMNGEYHGLYTLVDFIGEDFIYNQDMDFMNDIDSQYDFNLYKGTVYAADFSSATNPEGFEKKLGYPEAGDANDLDELIDFIEIIQEDDNFDTNFETYANAESYYDWWFFVSFLIAADSANKNAYHFQDLNTNKWYYIPWDLNESLGQDTSTCRVEPEAGDGLIEYNDIFKKIVNNDYFSDQFLPKYKTLLEDELSVDSITGYIDDFYTEVQLGALTDEDKWGDTFITFMSEYKGREVFITFEEEIVYIKEWVEEQHALWYARVSE